MILRLIGVALLFVGCGRAADYYFDTNGTAPGSGVVSGGSYAATGSVWNAATDGTGTPITNPGRQGYFFSAGTDAFGLAYTLTGTMGQVSQGITVDEGAVTLAGGGTFFGSTTVRTKAGTSLAFATSNWDFYNNTVTFETAADAPITLNSLSTLSGRGGNLVKTGPGRLTITGNATARGITATVNAGELRLLAANALFTSGYSAAVTVNSGGTLALSGGIAVANNPATLRGPGANSLGALRSASGNNSWNALLTLGANTRLSADSGATLTLNPASGDAVTGAFILTLGGAGDLTVSRPLSALVGLVKDGDGTAVLAAVNPFDGPVTVSGGTLRFVETGGVLATVAGPLAIDASVEVVNSAAQTWSAPLSGGSSGRFVKQGQGRLTLPGSHPFGGALVVRTGVLALAADAAFSGPLRLEVAPGAALDTTALGSGLVLSSGQTLAGAGGLAGPLSTLSASVLEPTPGSPLFVSGPVVLAAGTHVRVPATLANGTYPVLRSSGVISAPPAALVLTGFASASQVAALQLDSSATELALVVSVNPYNGRALVWTGDASANRWDAGVSATWLTAGAPVVFTPPDAVTFDATGAANPVVTLVDTLLPASVTIASSTDYTFTGSGTIAGTASLAKSGSGRLTVSQTNTFTGGTTITGGSLEVRVTGALGSGSVENSATLALAPDAALVFANNLTGSGSLTVAGGVATVTGDNTFTGPATVVTGTLTLGHVQALGSPLGATTVSPGSTLDLAGLALGAEPVVLAGGTLRNSAANAASLVGPVSLSAPSFVSAAGEMTLSGALGGTTPLTVASGLVRFTGDSSAASVPLVVAAGATLGGSGTLGGALTVAGTLAPSAGLPGVATLSVPAATLQPDSVTSFRLQKTNNAPIADRLAVSGTLTLGGAFSATLSGQPLAAGDAFTVFSAASFTGAFSSVTLPYLSGDLIWDRSALATSGVLRVIALPAVSTLAQRRDWLLTRLGDDPGGVDGFSAAGGFFARGDVELGRLYALNRSRSLLANHLGGAVQVDLFYIWPAVDLVARYGPFLDAETKANIRQVVLTFNQYKDTTTSNLKTLSWVTRHLGGQLYGEAAFDAAVDANGVAITNDWRSSDPAARAVLLGHLDTVVASGFGEIASRPYFWKNLLPLLSLGQLAQDPVIRQRAALAYEAGLAQNAGYWLRGHLAMPTSRSYPDMLEQHPSSGASMGMFWYHFGGDLPALDSDSALMTAVMNPTVSPLLELAAADRNTPFFSRSRNGGNYLQAYIDRDYALFADGPVGPNSGQVYANGVVWTDSSRSRYSHLWVAKPIHDDPSSINVSNTHGKETRQFSETVARDALLYSYDIAPPANLAATPTPTPYGMGYIPGGYHAVVNDAAASGQIFLHYGSVLIAIRCEISFGWDPSTTITYPSGTVRAGDSEFLIDGDTATTRPPATFTTPLTSNLRFAVAIETARPADFPGVTAAEQLAAFRAAILAIPKPSRPADAPTTAVYTTRRGDRLRLTKTQDASTYPVTINDAPVEYALFPRIENPWIYQPAGSTTLILRSGDRRETLDLATWSRTVSTGSIDVTPPVLANVPANLTVTPTHPQPTFTYAATATDNIDGIVPVIFTPPSGTVFTPGTTRVVTVTATDVSLNYARATFTVTVLPYPTPPAPAAPWSVQNIGAQPVVAGNAQHDVANRVVLVSGTGGTTGTGASGDIWTGGNEGFTYVSRPWTGDGVFTARVWSLTANDSGAKVGIMFRETNATGAKNSIVYLSPSGSAFFQNKTSTNGGVTSSSASSRVAPEWIRLVRSGNTFTAFVSADGVAWNQLGGAVTHTLAGSSMAVGLAVAPRTGGQTASAIFDQVTFLGPRDEWRRAAFGTEFPVGSAADLADPDGDGVPNLLEYALSGDPLVPDGHRLPAGSLLSAPASAIQLTFTRHRADLTYVVEAASDLAPASWVALATNPGVVGQPVTVTDPAPGPRRFLRLRVTASSTATE